MTTVSALETFPEIAAASVYNGSLTIEHEGGCAVTDEQENEIVWFFSFGLEAGEGEQISRRLAEDLLDYIIVWAEKRGLQVGGGYAAGSSLECCKDREDK